MTPLPIRILVSTLALLAFTAWGQDRQPQSLFGITNLSEIHLEISPGEWAKLQPPSDTRWDVGAAFRAISRDARAGRHFRSKKSTRPGLAGYLGIDHQYGRADVTIDGRQIRDVGLRFKGNGTFIAAEASGHYSFKIDFNEYDPDQEFLGLTKINLQNKVSDPTMLREALSYELFREAGIPCPRVGWARVTLTVPGVLEGTNLGVYGIVEQVDKRFLKDRFGSAKGLLMKPSTFVPFGYLGENWSDYEGAYFPKTDASPEQQQRLIRFTRLVQQGGDDAFEREIGGYLDVDEFLRFLSVNALLCNLDSFLGGSQNFYVYLNPKTDQFQ